MVRGPREIVYDEAIAPLMDQIIALCKQHGIPIVASFELDMDEDGPIWATTRILPEGSSRKLIVAGNILYGPHDEEV